MCRFFVLFVNLIFFPIAVFAQSALHFDATVMLSRDTASVGDTVIAAIQCKIDPGFHLYANPLGPGVGKPLSIMSSGSDSAVDWIDVTKEQPRKFTPPSSQWVWAYDREAWFFVRGIVRLQAGGTQRVSGGFNIDGLICNNATCLPVQKMIPYYMYIESGAGSVAVRKLFARSPALSDRYLRSIAMMTVRKNVTTAATHNLDGLQGLSMGRSTAPVVPESNSGTDTSFVTRYVSVESDHQFTLWIAIVLSLVAGIMLNVMPCVLPVVGIKILSFAEGKDKSRMHRLIHSGMFSLGMFSVFVVLAVLAALAQFSWGEQFQRPEFVAGLVCLIFVFGLGLLNIYTFLAPPVGGLVGAPVKSGHRNEFIRGVVAALLATPCSGPFMGATLAWAVGQSRLVTVIVILSIGVGMALPYIILSQSNALLKLIPRPGRWMEDFKFVMGFFVLCAAVYLMTGLPRDVMFGTVGMVLSLAGAIVFFGRHVPFGSSIRRTAVVAIIAGAIAAAGGVLSYKVIPDSFFAERQVVSTSVEDVWTDFSPDALTNAHGASRNVIVDFTASWCLNCQYNMAVVLQSPDIIRRIKDKKIVAMTADLTGNNPQAEALLHHLGSRSVPFMAVFPANDPYHPIILRDVLQKRDVILALDKLPDAGIAK